MSKQYPHDRPYPYNQHFDEEVFDAMMREKSDTKGVGKAVLWIGITYPLILILAAYLG